MSYHLELLPYHAESNFSQTVLPVNNLHQKLYKAIKDLNSYNVDIHFRSYVGRSENNGECSYSTTIEDPYGNKVRFVSAEQLKTVGLSGPELAYIQALSGNTPIALFWS